MPDTILADRLEHILSGQSLECFDEFCNENSRAILTALRAAEAGRAAGLATVAKKILDKLDHPTASVTQWDADELREALSALSLPKHG